MSVLVGRPALVVGRVEVPAGEDGVGGAPATTAAVPVPGGHGGTGAAGGRVGGVVVCQTAALFGARGLTRATVGVLGKGEGFCIEFDYNTP